MIKIMLLPEPFTSLPNKSQTILRLEKDETLFRQGDKARAMFFVVTGSLHLIRHTQDGHPVIIHRAMMGASFAEASLFSNVYHCDAVTSVPTTLVRLAKIDILAHLSADPAFTLALMKRFATDVQAHRKHLEILSIKQAEDRVFTALLSFGQRGNVTTFARCIGLTYEATLRALSSLVQQGKVAKPARGQYVVRTQQS